MSTMRAHTLIGGLCLSAVLVCWPLAVSLAQDNDSAARPAKVEVVAASEKVVSRSYPAIVHPSQEAEVSFRVSGEVVELPVRAAMEIEKGGVIAQLNPRDFNAQIAQLESQRDQALAQLDALRSGARSEEIRALEAAVAASSAQVDQARDAVERSRELAERGVIADARLEQDEAALRVAAADLAAQQEQLAIGLAGGREEEVAAAEAALRGLETQIETARDTLDDATLRAPFSGVIAQRNIDNFTNIQPGQAIVVIQALSTVHLVFDVPGPDVTELTKSDEIASTVSFDAIPGEVFPAELVEFSTQADAATQTYRGRVAVSLPEDARVLPGMVGKVTATADEGSATGLTVPVGALAAQPDGSPVVWVVTEANAVSSRQVKLGEAAGGRVEVVEGLDPGETVVSAGVSQLQEGMVIRPVTKIGG